MSDEYASEAYETACRVAQSRAKSAPHGIGAAYVRDRSESDQPGWYGEVAVDDGSGKKLSLLVKVSSAAGGEPHMPVHGDSVAKLLEDLAGRFETDDRLKELLAATMDGPGIVLDRWFPDEYRSVFAS